MFEKLPLFLIILSLSIINNLLIPTIIYLKKFGLVGFNAWGIIMDGILAGLMNITALNFLLEIKPKILKEDIILAAFCGFSAMIISHVYMSVKKWKIWIMPSPWHWNKAGYYHMWSATIQVGFLSYPAILLIKNPGLFNQEVTKTLLTVFAILLSLFILCLFFMKDGIKIGKFTVSGKFW